MDFKTLQQEAKNLKTRIQIKCAILFSELQDENRVVELGREAFELTGGELITSIFLETYKTLKIQTEIQRDGEEWKYNFNEVADIGDSLAMLQALENIKEQRQVNSN